MEVAQRLLAILKIYNDNSDLISSAVKDVQIVGSESLSTLRRGLDERRRKLILKAIALLAPSDVPAKVLEVDGVDDAELLLCRSQGWLEMALAIYLRRETVAQCLFRSCIGEFDEGTAFRVYSTIAAGWDFVELGDEELLKLVKPSTCECTPSGRQYMENARLFCSEPYQWMGSNPISCNVVAFEACRDGHRRFRLIAAVLVESMSGKVILYTRDGIKTSSSYTLDPDSLSGLEYSIDETIESNQACKLWSAGLAFLCTMFKDVNELPDWNGVRLVNSLVCRLAFGVKCCLDKIDNLEKRGSVTWIPSKSDLKLIHNRNDEPARSRLQRQFTARDALLNGIANYSPSRDQEIQYSKGWVLRCMANGQAIYLGEHIVKAYKEQKILPVHVRDAGAASVFATYIYSSLGQAVVAEEYRQIFSSRKVNICQAKSGTQIFTPHSGLVTMTTFGMECKPIKTENSQIFPYGGADRFALLPHLLSVLGLREDNTLLSILHKEMDDNAYLVADPMTANVRACMVRSFETSRRQFRISTLHETARQVAGDENYPKLVREAVSLLARLGATVPPEYVGRSCFYDVTRELKEYSDFSSQFQVLFDRGVTLDRVGCQISIDGGGAFVTASLVVEAKDGYVIAPINGQNLRRRPVRKEEVEEDDEYRAMKASFGASGLVLMRPVFDIHGEAHLAVTRSKPGIGIFSLFVDCEAR